MTSDSHETDEAAVATVETIDDADVNDQVVGDEVVNDKVVNDEIAVANIELSIAGRRFRAEFGAPAGPARPIDLLPLFQILTDALVDTAARTAEADGRRISCRAGCGACCRQLVPIAEVEALRIRDLVEDLPEPRRAEIRSRFDDARSRLASAGLLDKLRRPSDWKDGEGLALGMEYFDLGIPCPFLEEESCSIHADRPMVCREYLVTSPAELCAHPSAETIDRVLVPGKVSLAVSLLEGPSNDRIPWAPLVLAPDWADAHPDDRPARPGTEWVESLFSLLSRQAPAPPVTAAVEPNESNDAQAGADPASCSIDRK